MTPMTLSGASTPTSAKITQQNLIQTKLQWWVAPKAAEPAVPNVPVIPVGSPSLVDSWELDGVKSAHTTMPLASPSNNTTSSTSRTPAAVMPRPKQETSAAGVPQLKQGTSASASQVIVALPANQQSRRKIFDIPLGEDAMEDDELMERPVKRRVARRPNSHKEPSTPTSTGPREVKASLPAVEKSSAASLPDISAPTPVVVVVASPKKAAPAVHTIAKASPNHVQDYTAMEEKEAKLAARAARYRISRAGRRAGRSRSSRIPLADDAKAPERRACNVATRGRRGSARRGRITRTWQYFTQLRPQYLEFVCEWQGCPAKLFNMDTMRRHVEIVHMRRLEMEMAVGQGNTVAPGTVPGTAPGTATATFTATTKYACLWTGCADTNGDKKGVGRVFDSIKALRYHMEEDHMVPMSWHMGDGPVHDPDNRGPQVLRIGEPLPDYLFDSDGNQVTPDIRNQEIESVADNKARMRRLRKFMADVIANLPDIPADEEVDPISN